jgi:transposase-like protein
MDFPIVDLLDDEISEAWLWKYCHPEGRKCPHCGASVGEARAFRRTTNSRVTVYRCNCCQGVYNVYSGTVFEAKHFRPAQAILLLRGVCKGQPAAEIAREIGVSRQTVHEMRKTIQANAEAIQPESKLSDERTETDEMFQNAGEKR